MVKRLMIKKVGGGDVSKSLYLQRAEGMAIILLAKF